MILAHVGCTTTRTVASVEDGRLRSGGHTQGFAAATRTPWRSRIDAQSKLRVRSKAGAWSAGVVAGEVYVNDVGLWVERKDVWIPEVLDRVEIAGASPIFATLLAATKPRNAQLVHDGDRWVLAGGNRALQPWLIDLDARIAGSDSEPLHAELAQIRGVSDQGITRTLNNSPFRGFMDLETAAKFGWAWSEISALEVENLSPGKTFGVFLGTSAFAILLLPIALVGSGGSGSVKVSGPKLGLVPGSPLSVALDAADAVANSALTASLPAPGSWEPQLAPTPVTGTSRMFTLGARVHALLRGTLTLDTSAAFAGDHLGTGLMVHARIAELLEVGGGVRGVMTKDARGWASSTTGVFYLGWHLSLDADYRFAIPVGFEVGGGGEVGHDVRFPFGLRYTTPTGRYFATIYPATPQHLRVTSERAGRWSSTSTLELGVSF